MIVVVDLWICEFVDLVKVYSLWFDLRKKHVLVIGRGYNSLSAILRNPPDYALK
jgi:hypothetical protein